MRIYLFNLLLALSYTAFGQNNLKIGNAAPNINITNWIKNTPNDTRLKDKNIVLEFWTTWCGPCIKAVPHLNQIQREFKDRNDLVFISLTNESIEKIERTLMKVDFQSAVVSDQTNETFKNFGDGKKGLKSLPLTVLIDKNNIIRWFGDPQNLNYEILKNILDGKSAELQNINIVEISDGQNISESDKLDSVEMFDMQRFMKLVSDKGLNYFFELKRTNNTIQILTSEGTKIYANSSITLKELFGKISGLSQNQISVPQEFAYLKYSIIYKNLKCTETTLLQLENEIIKKLNFEKVSTTKIQKIISFAIQDTNCLEHTLEKSFSTVSEAGDLLILKKQTLSSLFQNISKYFNDILEFEDSCDKNEYDFIINISSPENTLKCLKSYGIVAKFEEKQIEYIEFKRKLDP
jgi:thiol-disulfide isomerase/thioredoxin